MAGKSGVRAAYWYEDPAVYISAVFGGTVGYAGPPLLQGFLGVGASDCASDGNCDVLNVINKLPSRAQNHDIDKIANDILDWVGHGEKGKVIINEAKDVIVRNVDNTRRFRVDLSNPSPHQYPHMHLEWIDDIGKWVSERIWFSDIPHQ